MSVIKPTPLGTPRSLVVSRLVWLLTACLIGCVLISSAAFAQSTQDITDVRNGHAWYGATDQGKCSTGSTTTSPSPSGGAGLDYAGRPILTQGQLAAISQNQPTYQQAASQVGIPWQMLAVVHLRESGLKVENPGNGQGIYQFFDMHGGPYPAGPVSPAEFLRQSVLAAQFLLAKAGSNYAADQTLNAQASSNTIKDTFFSYNGRAQAYVQQAASLGFNPDTQGFEGSPYVMNKADAHRDPTVNPLGWGQIKTDGGGISYPANSDYGAFVEYGALTGFTPTGTCGSSGSVDCAGSASTAAGLSVTRQNVVCLTEKELQLWTSGQLTAQSGYLKYSQNVPEEWCADFASWIYDQAQYPLKPDPAWRVPAVAGIQAIGEGNANFHYHNAGVYTPKPGDLAIHLSGGSSHVNIVVGVSGTQLTLVGGDQGHGPYPGGSVVSEYTTNGFVSDNISGYVSPD